MPARDPAASPSHPSLSPNISIGNHAVGSPSSSGYSFASLVSPKSTTLSANVPIHPQQRSGRLHAADPTAGMNDGQYGAMGRRGSGGAAQSGRRKLSLSKERQVPPGHGAGLGMGQPAGSLGPGDGRRESTAKRKPSFEWTEDL